MNNFTTLLSPIKIGSLTFKNRIISSPMSLAYYGPKGLLTPESVAFFEIRARGGCAQVTIGESIPEISSGQSHPQQIPLDDPDVTVGLVDTADAIHAHNCFASIELSHGGKLCPSGFIGGRNPIGPCAGTNPNGDRIIPITEEMMNDLADKYVEAAKTVLRCGFDMIMIHGAHGWLLHQFLSPLTNHRTDSYGGSLENRARFPLMIVDRVRQAIGPHVPIEFRMSGSELCEGGYEIDTAVGFAEMLDGKVELIHVSAGTKESEYSNLLMHPSSFQPHAANLRYAAEIKKHVKTPVASVGGFSIPEEIERILEEGQADVIAMARGLLAESDMPRKLEENRRGEVISCIRCLECTGSMAKHRAVRCTVNPDVGHEAKAMTSQARAKKHRVLIAGGGPGGMNAAITAADRGHEVILCEVKDALGGPMEHFKQLEFKGAMVSYHQSLIDKIANRNIDVRLNTPVTPALVSEIAPDALIAAIGADPIVPSIHGINAANVMLGIQWRQESPVGQKVVVIGGGLAGSEIGIQLGRMGHDVTILELRPEMVLDCNIFHRVSHLHELTQWVTSANGISCTAINHDGVEAVDCEGTERFFPCDTVIAAVGMRARTKQVEELRGMVTRFYVVGDCARPRKIMDAVREGHAAAMDL